MNSDPDVPPLAADRPMVDGTDRSSDDLRDEVQRNRDPDPELIGNNARLREDLAATAHQLAARLDLRTRSRDQATRLRDTALATGRAHSGLIAVAVGAVAFAVVLRRVRAEVRPL